MKITRGLKEALINGFDEGGWDGAADRAGRYARLYAEAAGHVDRQRWDDFRRVLARHEGAPNLTERERQVLEDFRSILISGYA